ncbi:hypothetical protein ScPMuIL_014377 [Solemya velum]
MAEKIKRKNRKVGKNRKKGWRSIDITDIEEHLEDERLQERTGGLVEQKPDEKLYFVDKDTKSNKKDQSLEPSTKKRKREPKPLKCFAILEPDPT